MELMETSPDQDQRALVAALLDPAIHGLAPEDRIDVLETHISYVLLAGPYAYKIKKPVDLGFLNFRALRARKFYCEEELRLNRRFAPELYLDVIPITGSSTHPVLGGEDRPIEYAVKMRRFSQDCLLDRLLLRDDLRPEHIDQLAAGIADFHGRASAASATDAFGTPSAVQQPALENFAQIRAADRAPPIELDALEQWTTNQSRSLEPTFRTRKRDGRVRECHGDLHLRNVALIDGKITLFDCLEFDPNLRWIDVMNEVAFLVMDLHDRKRPQLARRLLNRYLEITGDYAGLSVLRFYIVYRALVRAKVHCLRAQQPHLAASERERLRDQYLGYVALAKAQASAPPPSLIITHGLSGSGKTTCTQPLLELIGAVRIRSDVERKRLQGLNALARTESEVGKGAYSADATALTYRRLLDLTRTILEAGYAVIVDATFLRRWQRDPFRRFAQAHGVPFLILDVVADETLMRTRILERQQQLRDASEAGIAVLEQQIATQEPLQPDETPLVVTFDSRQTRVEPASDTWARVLEKLGRPAV